MSTMKTSSVMPAINLAEWVQEHRDQLHPPVGNKYLYLGEDFFVMVIGGPNARNDFHLTDSEEYFYQVKGDVIIRIREEDGRIVDYPIREGETFFIPPNVPHSPQRGPDTIGLVVERNRPAGETEHMVFYCESCGECVHDKEFDCKDIVEHFKDAMEAFWKDDALCTCKNCGTKVTKPPPRS
jgi:3-hydroxyanthranilate 3,4-dioxygenase